MIDDDESIVEARVTATPIALCTVTHVLMIDDDESIVERA
jgi:hypothetical protein